MAESSTEETNPKGWRMGDVLCTYPGQEPDQQIYIINVIVCIAEKSEGQRKSEWVAAVLARGS